MTLCGYDLPIDIGGLDDVSVDDGHPTDPSAYKHLCCHSPDPTETD